MPQKRLETVPVVRIAVEVRHGVEHARLDGLALLVVQPHDGAPAHGGEDGEVAGVGGCGLYGGAGGGGHGVGCAGARDEGGDDARADVQHDLNTARIQLSSPQVKRWGDVPVR